MKFLADENVELSAVKFLREKGYDVLYISERFAGCSDDKVFDIAKAEGRILLTNDSDFGEMVFRQGKVLSGVVLMRFASESIKKKINVIEHLLKHHAEKLVNHFIVVNEHQIRIRPLS